MSCGDRRTIRERIISPAVLSRLIMAVIIHTPQLTLQTIFICALQKNGYIIRVLPHIGTIVPLDSRSSQRLNAEAEKQILLQTNHTMKERPDGLSSNILRGIVIISGATLTESI